MIVEDSRTLCRPKRFCIVGNPNCGKTTLFNILTGSRQAVGNWPGVTVEKKTGTYRYHGTTWHVVDLPGIYSINNKEFSKDEYIARHYILSRSYSLVLNVVDANNIERNLYLTSQLLEFGMPIVVAISMIDFAKHHHVSIDIGRLEKALGCRVIVLPSKKKVKGGYQHNLDRLKEAVHRTADENKSSLVRPLYNAAVGEIVDSLTKDLAKIVNHRLVELRWLAIQLLESSSHIETWFSEILELQNSTVIAITLATKDNITKAKDQMLDVLIATQRYQFVREIIDSCLHQECHKPSCLSLSERIDSIVLNRLLSLPILLVTIYLMFVFSVSFGGAFVDFFGQSTEILLVEGIRSLLHTASAPEALVILIAEGLGSGVQALATFMPVVGSLYFFLSFIEESGYMARAAFITDRGMCAIGLPGKAFVPLIVGFGCNVPAIMATRTLNHPRDRLLAMMMIPFMSCGARLSVYVLFAVAFFPLNGQNIIFILYLIGVVFAIGTGLLLKKTFLIGTPSPFIMELPPYQWPSLKTVTLYTWNHLKDFVLKSGRVIVPIAMILSALGTLSIDGRLVDRDSSQSILANIGQSLAPVFSPMGLRKENWPAVVGLFSGIFAKEAVIGTLNVLYSSSRSEEVGNVDTNHNDITPLSSDDTRLWSALLTIPHNLMQKLSVFIYPFMVYNNAFADNIINSQPSTRNSMFGVMIARFDGVAGAFSYMLSVLLYIPCIAVLITICQESNWRWAAFSAAWGTGLSYIIAVISYQIMTFERSPFSASLWILTGLVILGVIIRGMWTFSNKQRNGAALHKSAKNET